METKKRPKSKIGENKWNDKFIALKTYYKDKKKDPDLEKPSTLFHWEWYQNQLNNEKQLYKDRIFKLNTINFKWDENVAPLKSKKEKAKSSSSSDVTCKDKATINLLVKENVKYKEKQVEL